MKFKKILFYLLAFAFAFTQIGTVKAIEYKPKNSILKNIVEKNSFQNTVSKTLDFQPADVIKHPTKPILYLTDMAGKKLYQLNYETNQMSYISLEYSPERMTLVNNELYVTALTYGTHDYSATLPASGKIIIINPDTFTITEQFNVDTDMNDIEVDKNGYIYLTPGGPNTDSKFVSYSRTTKAMISSLTMYTKSRSAMHPTFNKVYTMYNSVNPEAIYSYNYDNAGAIFSEYKYPYHGDYPVKTNIKISPDGKYIFNNGGSIYTCTDSNATDMRFVYDMKEYYTDIAFDTIRDRFYTGLQNGSITAYDSKTYERIGSYSTNGEAAFLFYADDKLVACTKNSSNQYMIEQINVSSMAPYPGRYAGEITLFGNVKGMIYDNTTNKAYAVEDTLNTLFILNLTTNSIEKTINLPYKPNNLCISEDHSKIYIVNNDANYLFSEVTLNNESIRSAKYSFLVDTTLHNPTLRRIYNKNNKVLVDTGDYAFRVLMFDSSTFSKVDYSPEVTNAKGPAITSDGKYMFAWDTFDSKVYRYIIGDHGLTLDSELFVYAFAPSDPNVPVLLIENEGLFICGKYLFNMNNFSSHMELFPEPIYVMNKDHSIFVGKKAVYYLKDDSYINIGPDYFYDVKFFSDKGLLYVLEDHSLYHMFPTPGDINCDSVVDMVDLALASQRYNAKKGTPKYDITMDYNYDDIIDIADLVITSRFMD